MIDIVLGMPLPNSAGLDSTNCPEKHDSADWTPNRGHAIGGEETTHSCCGSTCSHRGRRVVVLAEPSSHHGYNGTVVMRLVK